MFLPCLNAIAATERACLEARTGPKTKEEVLGTVATTQGLAAWRMTQGIYRIDPTVYADLIATPVTGDVPLEVLRHMPEWCVYIETPTPVVSSPQDVSITPVGLWYWLDEKPFDLYIAYDLGRPPPLGYIKKSGRSVENMAMMKHFDEPLPTIHHATTLAFYQAALSLILFVCAHAAEIQGESGPANPKLRKTRRGTKMFAAERPTIWNVGVRLGTALRTAYARAGVMTDSGDGGQGMRPHIRRAHWHTFLTGPRDGERRRSLRWLPPIPVGIDDYDTLPAVIREIKPTEV